MDYTNLEKRVEALEERIAQLERFTLPLFRLGPSADYTKLDKEQAAVFERIQLALLQKESQ